MNISRKKKTWLPVWYSGTMGKNVSVNLGKVDAILSENEQVKGEYNKPTERIKVYVLEVKDSSGKEQRSMAFQNSPRNW